MARLLIIVTPRDPLITGLQCTESALKQGCDICKFHHLFSILSFESEISRKILLINGIFNDQETKAWTG